MGVISRLRPGSLFLLALVGCSGDPSGPSGGASLTVSIVGLPSGTPGSVVVTGPGGFNQSLTSTQTLSSLSPGTYTVTATDVSPGGTQYSPSPASQSVGVLNKPVLATVQYVTATGTLAVNITGLGTSKTASVTVTGTGYSHFLTASATLKGLMPGDYTVSAGNPSAIGCSNNTPSPTSQNVTVLANSTVSAAVSYAAAGSGTVNLCIASMYLIQSAQNLAGTIPLVQDRDAYLRVFVVADQPNTVPPSLSVRLRIFQNSLLVKTDSVVRALAPVPTAPDESNLTNSWNYLLPAQYVQPGLSIEATVDPANLVTESNDSDNVTLLSSPEVRAIPTLPVTLVPILQLSSNQQGNVTDANKSAFFAVTRSMHPLNTVDLQVRANPLSTTTTLQSDGTGWQAVLDQVYAAAAADPSGRYYYGVAKVSYTSGVAGIAYVSTPSVAVRAALGWDALPSAGVVVAHELAHNWGRKHAPCGAPADLDANYPDPSGLTDGFGIDLSGAQPTLKPDTMSDIMGYCSSKWVSEYTYRGVFDYLAPPVSSPISTDVANQPPQPALLVWGHDGSDGLVLEPTFQITARPSVPTRGGPYRLEGRATDGSVIFSYAFAMSEVADLPGAHRSFAFAVPLSSAAAGGLSSIRLSGGGNSVLLSAAQAATTSSPPGTEVRRRAGGRVGVRWDPAANPMVMVRDPETGQVLAFARGGEAEVYTSRPEVDLVLSNGVNSRVKRVRVQ